MTDSKSPREFYMDTIILDNALNNCDLGDGYRATVRMTPHKDMLYALTKVIEYSAVEELQSKLALAESEITALTDGNYIEYQSLRDKLSLAEKRIQILRNSMLALAGYISAKGCDLVSIENALHQALRADDQLSNQGSGEE